MLRKFISYNGLPLKSGGAHRIGKADNFQIYLSLLEFFKLLTDNPKSCNTILFSFSDNKNGLKASFWSLVRLFGIPNWSLTGSINGGSGWIFRVREKRIPKAIELSKEFINLTLCLEWHFNFVDNKTKIDLKGQNDIPIIDERLHNSQVYLRLSQNTTISLWFTLPFNKIDKKAIDYINLIKSTLPVKMSNNHWQVWTLSKNGNWIARKLDVSSIFTT